MSDDVHELVAIARKRMTRMGVLTNTVSSILLTVFVLYLAPHAFAHGQLEEIRGRSLPTFVIFLAVTFPFSIHVLQNKPLARIESWMASGVEPTDVEQRFVLSYPRRWALSSLSLWALGSVVFTLVNWSAGVETLALNAASVLLTGIATSSLQYLLVERHMRPMTAWALTPGQPVGCLGIPGVANRLTIIWALASGIPLIGLGVLYLMAVSGASFDSSRLRWATLLIVVTALVFGIVTMRSAARSVAEPLVSLRDALASVQTGDFDVRVPIDDASEVGRLQVGFNLMTGGLADRQRLHEAFGAYVDPLLTDRVLREGSDLAGEDVEVSLLFMDVRGFTALSEIVGAREVVATLNGLYEMVVPIVLAHCGHANKFIGDGLLAVFGAPDRLSDHADRAVAAGLEIVRAVEAHYAGRVRVGVGINSGRVVAGTIGGGGRVDFTVIGDPVNTASRVEAATRLTDDDLLITGETLAMLSAADGWIERSGIALRGKAAPVQLFARRPRPQPTTRGFPPLSGIPRGVSSR